MKFLICLLTLSLISSSSAQELTGKEVHVGKEPQSIAVDLSSHTQKRLRAVLSPDSDKTVRFLLSGVKSQEAKSVRVFAFVPKDKRTLNSKEMIVSEENPYYLGSISVLQTGLSGSDSDSYAIDIGTRLRELHQRQPWKLDERIELILTQDCESDLVVDSVSVTVPD